MMNKIKQDSISNNETRSTSNFLHSKLHFAVMIGIYISLPVWTTTTLADTPVVSPSSIQYFNLPNNDLASTLLVYSQQSGIQIIASSDVLKGKASSAVKGEYTAQQALKLLLVNTKLNVRFLENNTAVISIEPNEGTRVLGAVKVQGSLEGGDLNSTLGGVSAQNLSKITGINGSRDLTATEGNNSYARGNVSIDGKAVRDPQKIAQSISTVNRQQLEDQQATSLNDALKNVAGINFNIDTDGSFTFYSRGYAIYNYTVDGLPQNVNSNGPLKSLDDMSLYDHVEVLRGTDSFLNQGNNSNPGGSVNLVRKKPLDHQQVMTELAGGSWDNRRASIDVTGPLTNDGRLKGRLIGTSVDNGEFWRDGDEEKNLIAGDLQYDLTPDTSVNLGFDYGRVSSNSWGPGIPFSNRGEDLGLPRDYSMVLPWANNSTLQKALRLSVDHNFNEDWSFHLKTKRNWSNSNFVSGKPNLAGFLPDENKMLSINVLKGIAASKNLSVNSSVLGKALWFGLEQNFELSGQYDSNKTNVISQWDYYSQSINNIADIDYDAIPSPVFNDPGSNRYSASSYGNAYLKLDLQPFESFHLLTGPRWNYTRSESGVFNRLSANKTDLNRLAVPYYALRYDWSKNWSTYASYTEIYLVQSNLATLNGSVLPPITGLTKEIGIKFNNDAKNLNMSLALFDTTKKNLSTRIYNDEIPDCCYVILDESEQSRGIEFELSGEITPYWQTNMSYAFNRNRRLNTGYEEGDPPLNSQTPEHTLKLSNTLRGWGNPWLEKLRGGYSINYKSREYRQDVIAIDPNNLTLGGRNIDMAQGGYAVSDLFLAYDVSKNVKAQLNFNNIFDKRYYETINGALYGGRYGEPRNVLFTVQAKF